MEFFKCYMTGDDDDKYPSIPIREMPNSPDMVIDIYMYDSAGRTVWELSSSEISPRYEDPKQYVPTSEEAQVLIKYILDGMFVTELQMILEDN